ncbi:MAG: L-seryl-tRNA(Sec) selenium transferase, partial [Planctomycetes bacterium]|nr:L-seryl-tRNA(Sec) selenium transferase [Planctomycetota bacterium]
MKKQKKKTTAPKDPRSLLPSVSALLEDSGLQSLIKVSSRPVVLEAIRNVLAHFGKTLKPGDKTPDLQAVIAAVNRELSQEEFDRIRPVVNAMGIILHTGLGRAPLAKEAAEALSHLHRCCNLQVDLETGERGKRTFMSEKLICKLTGAEAALIVNNNAAATFLILTAMCKGQEV